MSDPNDTIPWWHTAIGDGEQARLMAAFRERRFSMGPVAQELSRRLAEELQGPYVVVTPSGTAALTMALLACDIGPGDEVIVPNLTWIATAQAAAILGAKVVLVDSCPDSPCIDPAAVEKAITTRTKAILPVHFHGRPCDMEALRTVADKVGCRVIEDACKAMFCRIPAGQLGTLGDIGCFSMGMISLVSAGYGGFAVTRDPTLYQKMLAIRDHGMTRTPDDVYQRSGFNFKISDLLCSIALGQLDRLAEKRAHLREIYDRYCRGLTEPGLEWLKMIPIDVESGQIPLCIDLIAPRRDELCAFLASHGVQTSKYHPPLHTASYLGVGPGKLENSIRFAEQGFMPPCGPSQPLDNIDKTIGLMRVFGNY